jgi:DcuC family C4-dicarboxylate transporter
VRFLLVPGVILSGFVVNIPVVSQTSTAVCLGTVAVPLLRSAGFGPGTIGASLLLGSSVGGELLNPSAVELLAVKAKTGTDLRVLSWGYIPPLVFPILLVSLTLVWWWSRRDRATEQLATPPASSDVTDPPSAWVAVVRAGVPLVPLALLFLSGPPFELITIPADWVVAKAGEPANSRLIGLAMLIGVAAAAAAVPRRAGGCMKAFFDGAGYGFANVVSLIVIAQCFGKALEQVGLAGELGRLVEASPRALEPLAALLPCLFAVVCGSGIASSQSLYPFLYDPAVAVGVDPDAVGGLVSVGSAVGRTLSPVSAVAMMCGALAGAKATALTRRLAAPLLLGLSAAVLIHLARGWLRGGAP